MPKYFINKHQNVYLKSILTTFVFIVVLFIGYFIINLFSINTNIEDYQFRVCSLSPSKSKKIILKDNENDHNYEINDYLFYGEYLNLYHDEYSIFEKDELVGKSVILKNICDNQSYTYTNIGYIDGLIKLYTLDDGFYSIYINNNNEFYRAYSSQNISDCFYTIKRNNEYKKIELIADKKLVSKDGNDDLLNYHYLYLNVSTVSELPEDYYDVVLDPAYATDLGISVSKGKTYNDLNESEETYKTALIIKEELEKKGLKVLVTRNTITELRESYGEVGRLALSYDSKARYLIELSMNATKNDNYYGLSLYYSAFASNKMAVSVKNYLVKNSNITFRRNSLNNGLDGIFVSNKDNGFDSMMIIREAGGKATSAACYSDTASLNKEFAYLNRKGMMALNISLININNSSETDMWKEKSQDIAKDIALALLESLDVENDTTNK